MKVAYVSAMLASAVCLAGCSTELDGFGAKPSIAEANRVDASRAQASATPAAGASTTVADASAAATPRSTPARRTGAEAETATSAVTPRATADAVPLTPPPANPGGTAYAPSAAKEQLAGAWTFGWDNGQRTCPVSLSTKRGLSSLAAQADVSCPSEIFMTKGWDMMGPDLVLQNHQGKITARLRPSGPNRYVGVLTDTDQQVALTR